MAVGFLTIEDFDLKGKVVLIRVDINSPLDPKRGEILDSSRIKSYLPTIERLHDSKIVLLAHQSRPGKRDFTTLERHAGALQKLTKRRVRYVNDVFGECAKTEIDALKNGDILLLENVRFCSEEVSNEICSRSPAEQSETHLVKKLSRYVDFYVNDAFAVSHRSQPSVVGFPVVLPSCIGPTMSQAIESLSKVLASNEKPKVFSIGGAKANDSFRITKNVLTKDIADRVLLSGVASLICLVALENDIGGQNKKLISDLGHDPLVPKAKKLLAKFNGKIMLPVDMAFEDKGRRGEAKVDKFPDKKALDIGSKTIDMFSKEIMKARIVIAKGPAGVFEIGGFDKGTKAILEAVAKSKAVSIIGGGHLSSVVNSAGLKDGITYLGSGGGATVSFLSGETLPGIEAIIQSKAVLK